MDTQSFIVVTRSKFAPTDLARMLELAEMAIPIFKKQKGLKSLNFLASHDKSETSTILQWETKEDHEACMQSADFESFNEEWGKMMEQGNLNFELQTYELKDIYSG